MTNCPQRTDVKKSVMNNRNKFFSTIAIVAILVGGLASCKEKEVEVTGISINKQELTLAVGKTETLIATVLPDNAKEKNVTWSSSNSFVATVMPNGLVTGLGEGTTTIVATAHNGISATCVVKVKNPTSLVRFKNEDPSSSGFKMYLTLSSLGTAPEYYFNGVGASPYFEIPPGKHIPMFYLYNDYPIFDNPSTRDFEAGRKYTVASISTDPWWSFTDDGEM